MEAVLLDIIVLAIFAVFLFFGFKNGIIKSVLALVNLVVSAIASVHFSRILSNFVYEFFIKKIIIDQTNSLIVNNKIFSSVDLLQKLPKVFRNIILNNGINSTKIGNIISKVNRSYLPERISELFKPSITRALEPVLCILLFVICLFLGKILIKMSLNLFRPNLLKNIGGILGGVLGFFKAYVLISVLMFCLKSYMPNSNFKISEQVINSTVIFKYMYTKNFVSI